MALSPATVIKRSPFLFRLAGLSSNPISHSCRRIRIPGCPVESLGCFSRHSYQSISKPWHCHETVGFGRLGLNDFRALAVSGGGSGGIGGLGGSGGGGNGRDGDGGGGGGSKWSLLSWYLTLIEKYPVWTKAITSALLNLMGDLMCQLLTDQVQSPDLKRTFLFTILGLVLVGPTLHFWYFSLSKLVTLPGAAGAFLRLLLDQFLFSPIFIGVFLATLITLEGRPSEVVPKLQQEWFSSVVANWQLWIPFQFLNFRFVPQQFQVLAANFIALIWNVILSFKAHKEVLPK